MWSATNYTPSQVCVCLALNLARIEFHIFTSTLEKRLQWWRNVLGSFSQSIHLVRFFVVVVVKKKRERFTASIAWTHALDPAPMKKEGRKRERRRKKKRREKRRGGGVALTTYTRRESLSGEGNEKKERMLRGTWPGVGGGGRAGEKIRKKVGVADSRGVRP